MVEDFLEKFKEVTGRILNYEIELEKIVFEVKSKKFEVSREQLEKHLQDLQAFKCNDEDLLYSTQTYEVMIDFERGMREERAEFQDERNNLIYSIGVPSIEFMFFLIMRTHEIGRTAARRMGMHFGPAFNLDSRLESTTSFEDMLALLFRRVETIKITTTDNKDLSIFRKLADALTFEVAFNTGSSCVQIKHLEEFLTNTRIRNRRNRLEDCEPPKRLYNSDLIYHYQLGQSTIHPALKFISFYHVLEHFFNIVYTEKMIQKIRDLITKPSFSPKRDIDIEKVIKEVKNNFKVESESNNAKNEIEALKLVIIQFIDLDSLRESLNELDPDVVTYYTNHVIDFSQGTNIDFNDARSLPGKLANRIYKTRNAVIHSKANEKERYIPFEHESQLIREIPLIQFMAEEVILKTSEVL